MNPTKKDQKVGHSYKEIARMLSLAGNPTRLRILALLNEWQEGCVSSIADELDITVATASYHLNHLADNDYSSRNRDGQTVCYTLNDNDFVTCLQKLLDENLKT